MHRSQQIPRPEYWVGREWFDLNQVNCKKAKRRSGRLLPRRPKTAFRASREPIELISNTSRAESIGRKKNHGNAFLRLFSECSIRILPAPLPQTFRGAVLRGRFAGEFFEN
jgi:hypothetical protein